MKLFNYDMLIRNYIPKNINYYNMSINDILNKLESQRSKTQKRKISATNWKQEHYLYYLDKKNNIISLHNKYKDNVSEEILSLIDYGYELGYTFLKNPISIFMEYKNGKEIQLPYDADNHCITFQAQNVLGELVDVDLYFSNFIEKLTEASKDENGRYYIPYISEDNILSLYKSNKIEDIDREHIFELFGIEGEWSMIPDFMEEDNFGQCSHGDNDGVSIDTHFGYCRFPFSLKCASTDIDYYI